MDGLPPEERARLDQELAMPLGETPETVEARRQAFMSSQGWK